MLVFIGTYTAGESKGVYVYDFDPATGALTFTGHTAQLANPTFLAFHPNGQQLSSTRLSRAATRRPCAPCWTTRWHTD